MLKISSTVICTCAVFLALHVSDYFFLPVALSIGAGFGFAGLILMGDE